MRYFKMAVVVDHSHGFKPFSRSQRCRLQSFTHFDYSFLELNQSNIAHSLKQAYEGDSVHRSYSTPCLSLTAPVEEEFDTTLRIEIVNGRGTPRVRALVVEIAIAMASGVDPLPVSSGLGGAYFLRNRNGDKIAVAKPIDEEPLAFNNPKGFGGLMLGQPGLKSSVRVGETGIRESAAYLLDHGGFAGVPPTALVKFSNVAFHVNSTTSVSDIPSKIASLQRYVDHEFDAGELGPSGYSVASVHRIGIFDIRILNLDRHAGNMLVKKHDQCGNNYTVSEAELVPIDHGLCLPEWLDDPYFEWLHWPQALIPFSEFEIEYISNLNPFKDAELLRTELPSLRESSIRVLVLCTIFLKRAAAAGLCLGDIGEMMSRKVCVGEENSSVLENLCEKAKTSLVCLLDDDDDNNKCVESKEDIDEMFQFDNETEVTSNEVVELPKLLKSTPASGKPPKIPRVSSVKSMTEFPDAMMSPLCDESKQTDAENGPNIIEKDGGSKDENNGADNHKVNYLTRSMSYSVQNHNYENGGMCFGEMDEDEWELFLEQFVKLLPEVFEGTKGSGFKQRLGTSCEF